MILLTCLAAGCGGPSVGDVRTLDHPAVLYRDEAVFRRIVELDAAGSKQSGVTDEEFDSRWVVVLLTGSRLRVLAVVPNGFKAVVEEGYGFGTRGSMHGPGRDPTLDGMIGWVATHEIVPRRTPAPSRR